MFFYRINYLSILLIFVFLLFHLSDIYYDKVAQAMIKMFKIELEDDLDIEEKVEERKKAVNEHELHTLCTKIEQIMPDSAVDGEDELISPKRALVSVLGKMKLLVLLAKRDKTAKRDHTVNDYPKSPKLETSDDESSDGWIPSEEILGSFGELEEDNKMNKTMMRSRKRNEPSIDEEDAIERDIQLNSAAQATRILDNAVTLMKRYTQDLDMLSIGDEEQPKSLVYNPLEWPDEGRWNKASYVLLFPINLVYFFLFPNIADAVSKSKITIMMVIIAACTVGNVLVLAVFEYNLMLATSVKVHFLSYLNALIFVLP